MEREQTFQCDDERAITAILHVTAHRDRDLTGLPGQFSADITRGTIDSLPHCVDIARFKIRGNTIRHEV
jgi:hypothetical protein